MMRIFLLLLIITLHSTLSFGHDSHFGFAEVKYNEKSNTIQATVSLSTNDFERSLGITRNTVRLSEVVDNKILQLSISDEVLEHFQVTIGSEPCNFELIGIEVTLSGVTHFYFESQKMEFQNSITILFDNLVEQFPEQQNKATIISGTTKRTLIFNQLPKQTINLAHDN